MIRNVKSWSYNPIKADKIESLRKGFEEDHAKFLSDKSDFDLLVIAFGYVLGYPTFRQYIGNDLNEDGRHTRWHVLEHLNHVHILAVDCLIKEAERYGLDGSPLLEFGRLCRRLFEDGGAKYMIGDFHVWPECLGQSRETLPERDERTIRDGEAVLRRLNARVDIPLDDPVRLAWSLSTSALSPALASTPPHNDSLPDQIDEKTGRDLFCELLGIKPDRSRWQKERKKEIPSIDGCLTKRMIFKRVREIQCRKRSEQLSPKGGVTCKSCSRKVGRYFPGTSECSECYMRRVEAEYESKAYHRVVGQSSSQS